jgi:hypothetical protein
MLLILLLDITSRRIMTYDDIVEPEQKRAGQSRCSRCQTRPGAVPKARSSGERKGSSADGKVPEYQGMKREDGRGVPYYSDVKSSEPPRAV